MIPIVYKWNDVGAPTCTGERGSLINILTACLVNGYGSKAAAGWTKEYENGTFDLAAFRNDPVAGTGFYLQVDENTPTANVANLNAYELMSSESAGTFAFSATTTAVSKSMVVGTTQRPWILLATNTAMYFMSWPSETTATAESAYGGYRGEFFFGDLVAFHGDDASACMLICPYNSFYGIYHQVLSPSTTQGGYYQFTPRSYNTGLYGPYKPALVQPGGPLSGMPGSVGMTWASGDPYVITRPYFNDSVAYSMRGWWTGMYYPCHVKAVFVNLQSIIQDGRSYIAIVGYMANTTIGAYLLSLDDWGL